MTLRNYQVLHTLFYIARYLLLLIAISLVTISLLYGISNLIKLEATHFFCPIYTEEQVRQHNLENENAYGDSVLSCWYIERSKLDLHAVRSLDMDVFEASFDHFTPWDAFICIIYCLISLYLLIIVLYNGYLVIFDTFYAILACLTARSEKHKRESNTRASSVNLTHRSMVTRNPRIKKMINKMRFKAKHASKKNKHVIRQMSSPSISNRSDKYNRSVAVSRVAGNAYAYDSGNICVRYQNWQRNHCYDDSKLRLFSIIGKEWFEILIQIYGLFLYGGVDLFDANSNVLAQHPNVVRGKCKVYIHAGCLFSFLF